MALYDLLERSRPGASPVALLLGLGTAAGAYALALYSRPDGIETAPWMLLVMSALVACAGSGLVERGASSSTATGILSAAALTLGACLAVTVLVMALPAQFSPTGLGAAAERMPIDIRTAPHDGLKDAPEVFGPYLVTGAFVALTGACFGSGGALLLILLQALAWAVLLGEYGRAEGGVPAGIVPTLHMTGVTAMYLGPALVGLLCVGGAGRTGMKRFFGGRSTDGDSSLRGPGLACILGLLALLLAGAVELFGGGSLARMLEGG